MQEATGRAPGEIQAQEKSARSTTETAHQIKAPSLSLPKGGGAIRGIGAKFAANPVTGTGSMTVPIATSPGRLDFGPAHSLAYDSGAGQAQVRYDLISARNLWQQRNAYTTLLMSCKQQDKTCPENQPLAELVNPLMITKAAGTLKRISYGSNPDVDVSFIKALSHKTLVYYKQHNLRLLKTLIGRTLTRLRDREGLIDWFDYCTHPSEEK